MKTPIIACREGREITNNTFGVLLLGYPEGEEDDDGHQHKGEIEEQ